MQLKQTRDLLEIHVLSDKYLSSLFNSLTHILSYKQQKKFSFVSEPRIVCTNKSIHA